MTPLVRESMGNSVAMRKKPPYKTDFICHEETKYYGALAGWSYARVKRLARIP